MLTEWAHGAVHFVILIMIQSLPLMYLYYLSFVPLRSLAGLRLYLVSQYVNKGGISLLPLHLEMCILCSPRANFTVKSCNSTHTFNERLHSRISHCANMHSPSKYLSRPCVIGRSPKLWKRNWVKEKRWDESNRHHEPCQVSTTGSILRGPQKCGNKRKCSST